MDSSVNRWLEGLNLVGREDHPRPSGKAFDGGGRFQIEIPEVENAAVLEAALDEARARGVTIHRVSQGTGVTKLSFRDLEEMAKLGSENKLEVYLFMGLRGENGYSVQARSVAGGSAIKRIQGSDRLAFVLRDIERALEAGIRGFLISDEGLLRVLGELRKRGELPADVSLKTSVSMGHGNQASAKMLEDLGADSFNAPVDLHLETLRAIRECIDIPIDQYIEAPGSLGGLNRLREIDALVDACAPINLKFGLCTEASTDPVGLHTQDVAIVQVRERVRLAEIGLELLAEAGLESAMTDPGRDRGGIPVGR